MNLANKEHIRIFVKKFSNNKLTCPHCKADYPNDFDKLYIGAYGRCSACHVKYFSKEECKERIHKIVSLLTENHEYQQQYNQRMRRNRERYRQKTGFLLSN